MKPTLAVLIMINNYFHDLATAMLAASGFAMLGIRNLLEEQPDKTISRKMYRQMSILAVISLLWTLLGGIPRTIYFKRLEWWDAAGKGIIPALIVKHILMVAVVFQGVNSWRRLRDDLR